MNGIVCKIKDGVNLSNIHEKMWGAVPKISSVYEKYGIECVITSGRDGTHSPHSLHYAGKALDIRTNNIGSDGAKVKIFTEIKAALGDEFDVVLESDHIHAEFDPT